MRVSKGGAYDWKCGQWSAHVSGGDCGIEEISVGAGVGVGVGGGRAVDAVARQEKRENDGGADTRRSVIFPVRRGNG